MMEPKPRGQSGPAGPSMSPDERPRTTVSPPPAPHSLHIHGLTVMQLQPGPHARARLIIFNLVLALDSRDIPGAPTSSKLLDTC